MTERRDGEPIDILLIEDNPGDVRLTKIAFEEGRINNDLHVATDGEAALDFLYKRGRYHNAPRPDITLLDLNLPKVDGREVLRQIKNDDDLKTMPVIVLTSSEAEIDVLECYKLQSNAYITKPVTATDFIDLVRTFEEFWFTLVRLPPKPE